MTDKKWPDKVTTKYVDDLTNPTEWIDFVGLVFYMAGQNGMKIPVEWGRERIEKFIEKEINRRIRGGKDGQKKL